MLNNILEDFKVFVLLLKIIYHQLFLSIKQSKHLQMIPLCLMNTQVAQSAVFNVFSPVSIGLITHSVPFFPQPI